MKVNILIAATCHADVTQSRHPSALISTCEVCEVLFASFSPFVWTVPLDGGDSCWRSDFYVLLHFSLLSSSRPPFILCRKFTKAFFFLSSRVFSTCLKINGNWIFYSSEGIGGGRGMWIPSSLTHTHTHAVQHTQTPACRECWCVCVWGGFPNSG